MLWLYLVKGSQWGRVTHICVGNLTIIGSDNGLSPDRRQAIIWTNAGLLSIEPLRTYFSENYIKIQPFSLKKMHVKMLSAKWRPFCLGLNVLTQRLVGYQDNSPISSCHNTLPIQAINHKIPMLIYDDICNICLDTPVGKSKYYKTHVYYIIEAPWRIH